MSDIDPYAPVEYAPTTEEAKTIEKAEEVAPVEAAAEPEVQGLQVPDGSAKDVLGWVGEDVDRAKAALVYEEDNQKRSTLITKLTAIID
jgi:hypothetical protein